MKASLFYLPTIGSRAEIEAGMAGMRPDLYQRMLRELTEQIKLADELGYDSVSFTEHHFHIEGFEVSNNPVLLDLYFAMQTKRIRVGQLGIVLPASNPIRVAEDIAMLDHMTGGRANAGFARGYQRRWVDIMAQQTHGIHGALPHQHDEIDAANRAAFEENFQHHQEVLDRGDAHLRGQVLEGAGRRDAVDARHHGQVGQGREERHPDVGRRGAEAVAEAASADVPAVRLLGELDPLCAKEGVTPILPPMLPVYEDKLYDVYAEVSGKPSGQGMGVLRDVIIADTDAEAMALWREFRPVLRPRLVRAVRLPPRHAGPEDRRAIPTRRKSIARAMPGRHGRHGDCAPWRPSRSGSRSIGCSATLTTAWCRIAKS